MSIIVSLALASICFTYSGVEECHPILLGKKIPTPQGQFQVIQRFTDDPGYGGDVLQFYEDNNRVFAIHRVWLMIPSQHREYRLKSSYLPDRFISSGCINVEPWVYERLVDCCSSDILTVK